MNVSTKLRHAARKVLLRPTNIPAAIALIVVVLGAVFAEQQNNAVYRQDVRAGVLDEVNLVRSRLEGNINANIQLVRGLVSTISTEPHMDEARFAALAGHLFDEKTQLREVAGAPDLVIRLVYPLEGNEDVLGLDYRTVAAQRDAVLRVRDTGKLVLAGPVDLVQGGLGIVGRFPVFTTGPKGEKRFWGVVAAVVDAGKLFAASGLDANLPIDIAIRGKDGTGANGALFYGPRQVLDQEPVTANVQLPSGSWQILAVPHGGWQASPPNLWIIRGFAALAGALVVLPILLAGWLFGERYGHLRELKASERALQRMSARLTLALQASRIGVWENEATRGRLFWDRRMRELYGAPPTGEVTYDDWAGRLHPDDRAEAEKQFDAAIAARGAYASEFRVVMPNGEIRTLRAMGQAEEDAHGAVRIIGVNWDISEDVRNAEQLRRERSLSEMRNAELEDAKARIEHNALHDSLTGLPNRRYLDELLSGRSDIAIGEGGVSGLLHVDLDRFKQINDTLGHAAGDAMLVHAAGVLRDNVRLSDFVARIGGDEFVVVCMSRADERYLERLAARLVEKMRQPVVYQGRECRFGVSIGIAGKCNASESCDLLINADIALYRAKNDGRNTYRVFTEDLHMAAVTTKRVADEVLTGIEQGQFTVHYQGQFDARTLKIAGVEALARWHHPEKGLLTPDAFIDVADDLNVTADIDALVLDQALRQMKRWRKAGVDVPRVSVNVSARRLADENLIAGLKALDFEPGSLTFELVESVFLDNRSDLVSWNIDQIRELGIAIEIDDFGTGYASIVSLMQLLPARLKIDRQLVLPTIESAAQRDLVRSIVRIGASLGINSVGEGVETMEHARVLRDLGCEILQGYALARPMSGRAFTNFARKGGARSVA